MGRLRFEEDPLVAGLLDVKQVTDHPIDSLLVDELRSVAEPCTLMHEEGEFWLRTVDMVVHHTYH